MADTSNDPTSADSAVLLVKLSTEGVPKLYCPTCNKALLSLAGYVRHLKKHEHPGGFTCRYCETRFCSDDELKKHRESEHTTIACRLCKDVMFTNEVDYREHIRNVHKGLDKELFSCDKYGAVYKTVDPYRRHMETECGRFKLYKCEHCPMTFVTKYNLKQHLDIHSYKLKCCCSYCGRKREGTAPQPTKKKVIKFAAEDDDFKTEEFIDENEENNFHPTPKQKIELRNNKENCMLPPPEVLMSDNLLQNQKSVKWSNDIEDEYVGNFEPADSDSDKEGGRSLKDFNIPMPIASIKQKNYDEDDNCLKIITRMGTYSAEIKCENEEYNLFDEKGRILESLVNENDNSELTEVGLDKSNNQSNFKRKRGGPEKSSSQDADGILKEAEVVYRKYEVSGDEVDRKDILEEMNKATEITKDDIMDSYVLLEDVTNCFPKLKDTSTVNVLRNVKPLCSKSEQIKKIIEQRRECRRMRTKSINTEAKFGKESKSHKYRLSSISGKQLRAYMRRDKSRQCPECIKIYYRRKPFEMHLRNDHKKSEDFIKQIFRNDLEKVSADIFKCHICDKVYLVKKRLLSHITKHGPDGTKVHKCSCCTLYYATREEATAHAHEEHKDLLWCALCKKFMISSHALNSHKARIHDGKKNCKRSSNLVCTKCGKEFMVLTLLIDHERSDCDRLPLYQCQKCGKCLKTAHILMIHMLLHNDARPYQCDKCGRTFKIKGRYKHHIKYYHVDRKRYKCHLCPKEYPHRQRLLTHMSVHTDIKQQAKTCGPLPLNTIATQMGVQKGNLLMSAKPEFDLDCMETGAFVAQDVIANDFDVVEDNDHKMKGFIDENEEDTFSSKLEQNTKMKIIGEKSILPPSEALMSEKLLQNQKNTQRSDDIKNEYVPDIEQADEKEERSLKDLRMTMSVASIKQKNYNEYNNSVRITTNIQIEHLDTYSADVKYENGENHSFIEKDRTFETMDTCSAEMKYEAEEYNLCDNNDRIFDHLLNKNDFSEFAEVGLEKSNNQSIIKRKREKPERNDSQDSDDILKEAEVVYRKYEVSDDQEDDREDILEEVHKATEVTKDHIRDCYVLLEDVTNCFPLLKDTCTVKVPSNVQPSYSKSKKITKHGSDGALVYECPCHCSLYFKTREEATAHAQQKHKNILWCELCEKFMASCEALNSHKAQTHGGNMNYKCSRSFDCLKCGKKFMERTNLTYHERSDCGRLPLYQCQKCGKCLTTARSLRTHILLHNDATPYQCDKCGKSFKKRTPYTAHIKYAHNAEKRYKCHLCPKQYPYRESLFTHMSLHTGIKRYKCYGCGNCFSCISSLIKHRRIRPESCGLLPLNTKATQYMGLQNGTLLIGAKPEFGLDCMENRTFVGQKVITNDFDVVEGDDFKTKEFIDEGEENNFSIKPEQKTKVKDIDGNKSPEVLMSNKSLQNHKRIQRSDDIENEYVPDIERADSASNEREGISLKTTEVTKEHIRDCYVLLEDVTNCFPLLKETCTVKVPSNVQPSYYKSKKITKHGSDGALVYECPCNCSLYFTTREEATAHAQQQHKDILWCELCEKFMASCEALNSHKAQTHGGNMNYKCSRSFECLKCGKKFMERTNLTYHERSDCGRLPLYQCDKCGKCLKSARSLKAHILLHNDATPYQCDKCGKSFKVSAPYRAHIKYAHNDEMRYKCHLCPKQYPYRESLFTHMSVHTGIKRYKCDACDMRFSCVSSLLKHHRLRPETCGLLPLNTKPTHYLSVQNGSLLIDANPTPGSERLERL